VQGYELTVGDFRVRVGQVKVQGTHEVKVIMADVQYCPLEDLEAAQPALKVDNNPVQAAHRTSR
jgi:hypothetical protein